MTNSLAHVLTLLALSNPAAQSRPAVEADWPRLVGDYRVTVYPQAFGFLLQDGRLHLRMGGVKASGRAAPLIAKPDGKFVLSEGHPNAMQFLIEGDRVRFILWGGSQQFPGTAVADSAATPASAPPPPAAARQATPDSRTRADVIAQLDRAAQRYQAAPSDPDREIEYLTLLFQAGEFWKARDLAATAAGARGAPRATIELAAKLEYLVGRYDASDALFQQLVAADSNDLSKQVMSKVGLMFSYYQRNKFDAIKSIEFPAGVQLPNYTLVRSFEQPPYRLTWPNDRRTTEVPFFATDPLPQFAIEVNDVPVQVIFDTGADLLILDDAIAKALGVRVVATAMGTFGGGLQSPLGFGRVDRVKIGDVVIEEVPVMILPTKRFTFDHRYVIGGVLGTALLRQFLGTIDYQRQRLVLRDRSPKARADVRTALGGSVTTVPFALDATHLMLARGRLDDSGPMTWFVDSGLASDAWLTVPAQTLRHVGIPEPAISIDSSSVGGGGGKFATGPFPIRRLSLGGLEQRRGRGSFGPRPQSSYWERGYITDGLISHQFLRRYRSWTLDFDAMEYLFAR